MQLFVLAVVTWVVFLALLVGLGAFWWWATGVWVGWKSRLGKNGD